MAGLCLAAVSPLSAASYYVSSSSGAATDSGPGTMAQPWKTIAKVNSTTLAPGDTVHFLRGDTWRETLSPPNSGNAANRVTFTAYGAGTVKPVISGAEVVTGWSVYSGGTANTYSAPLATATVMVTSNSAYIKKGASKDTLALNQYRWEAGVLYINIGADPSGATIEAGQRNSAVAPAIGRHYITLNDLRVEKTNVSNIHINQSNFWRVENCEIYFGNSTSSFAGGGVMGDRMHDAVITGCHINYSLGDGVMAWRSARVEVSNNVIENVLDEGGSGGADGIQIGAKPETPNACDGFKILNNIVSRPSTEVQKGCIIQEMGDNGIIAGNQCFKGRFSLSSSGNNNIIEHNYCTGFGTAGGIRVSENTPMSGMKIRYNIVSQSPGFAGITIMNDKGGTTNRSNFEIYNNTVYNTYYGIVVSQPFSGSIRNNIVWSPSANPRTRVSVASIIPGETLTINNNIYKDASTEAMASIAGTVHYNLASIQAAGYDLNSSVADPLFVNAGTQDFHLQPGSPAIDFGANVGLTEDYAGTAVPQGGAPDLGALEYVAPLAVYEGFNYSAGSIAGAAGGIGWSGAWAVSGGAGGNHAVTSGFSYTGLPVTGNRLQVYDTDGVMNQVTRGLTNSFGAVEGTYWISFLAKKVNAGREAYINFGGLGLRAYQALDWQVKTPNTSYATLTGATTSVTRLFLLRVDSTATSDIVRVWVDPVIASGEPSTGSALATLTDTGMFSFNSVSIKHGPWGTASQCGEWDEIRIGSTFQSVVSGP